MIVDIDPIRTDHFILKCTTNGDGSLHDDRNGPLSAALWGLNEAVQGSTGLAHTAAEVKGYLQGAGFAEVTVHPFVPGVLSRIAGRKPD